MFNTNSKTHGFMMRYGGVAAVVVLGIAGFAWVSHPPALAPEPQPAPKPAAVHTAQAHTAAPAHPATIAPATSAPAPTVALGPVMLPAQPAPAGVARGYAQRAIASSPAPAVYGDRPQWTPLATAAEPAPTGSWSTAVPAALRAIGPSTGLVQTQITAYIRVQQAGAHTLVLSANSGPVRASLTIDGQAQPLAIIARTCSAFTGCPATPTTSAGSVALAAGLHQILVTAQTAVGDAPAVLDVYARGPGASMPVAITPWAVHATTATTQE